MHEAKRRGRNGYLFHSPTLTAQTRSGCCWSRDCSRPLSSSSFASTSPLTDLADGHLSGLEVKT